ADAVSGVVNCVLDKRCAGVKGVLQGGGSTDDDYNNYRAAVAYGAPVGDRAHVLLSVDRYENSGFLRSDRPIWSNAGQAGKVVGSTARSGTAANPYIIYPDLHQAYDTPGGFVTSGPFAGTTFLSPGIFRPVNPGNPTGTPGI